MKVTEADRQFSLAIRTRDNWTCRHCGAHELPPTKFIQCAHIYSRQIKATRYSADNAVTLCAKCHKWFTERPSEFHIWLVKELGQGHMDLLREKSNAIGSDSKATRAEVSKHYREQITLLNAGRALVSYN